MTRRLLITAVLLAGAVGCTETRTYAIRVHNGLSTPVTVCLTKRYGPSEPDWISPEELAAPPHPASDQVPPGQVVPPGKTATRGPVAGAFDPRYGRAFLRVYVGTPTLTQMNAMSPGSANRVDVPLEPGPNAFDVQQSDTGRVTAVALPR